jgi:hypothetical protein
MACFGIVEVFGMAGLTASSVGASHVLSVFEGKIPPSLAAEYLRVPVRACVNAHRAHM